MKIRVEEIKAKPINLSAEEAVGDYPPLLELSDSGECEFTSPIKIRLTAARESDLIRVDGDVSTTVLLGCSRCLESFEVDLNSSFTLFYEKKTGFPVDADAELSSSDLVSVAYDGDYIDFTAELAEQLIMEIPYKTLCKDGCKGLCSNCGANLNAGECGCGGEKTNFKFGALKDFKVKK